MTFQVKIVEGGKIVLPAAVRRKHGYQVGQTLLVDDSPDGIRIRSLDDVIGRAREILAGVAGPDRVLSDEIIADRRRDADRE